MPRGHNITGGYGFTMGFKIPQRSEVKDYLYVCDKCGEETWFTVEFPEHLLVHYTMGGYCGGRLNLKTSKLRYPESVVERPTPRDKR